MNLIIKFVLFAGLVAKTFGHPYAQLIPIRVERAVARFDYPSVRANQLEFYSSKDQPQCPCAARSCQRAFPPQATYNAAPELQIAQIAEILPRLVGAEARTQTTSSAISPAYESEVETPFMRNVRSMASLPGIREFAEGPVDVFEITNPTVYSDTAAKKGQSLNSQLGNVFPEGYGMSYNLRVQSFNSIPDQREDESRSKADTDEPKDSKFDNQQSEIVDTLEQLQMGQWMAVMQQQNTESMIEREFKNQESSMRGIKSLLNSLRKDWESRNNEVASEITHSELAVPISSATSSSEAIETSQGSVTTPTAAPETTSTVPTTTAESIVSTEKNFVPAEGRQRR